MNPMEFDIQMGRLRNVFGDKNYPDERTKLIWSEVRDLPQYYFAKLCDRFIGDSRQAPILNDFRTEAYQFRLHAKPAKTVEPWKVVNPGCDTCFDTGVFLARSKTNPGPWAFRCACSKGVNDPRKAIPHFTESHRAEFVWADPREFKGGA